jgi:hypothetical protein
MINLTATAHSPAQRKEREGQDEEVHRIIIGVPDWTGREMKMQYDLFDATPVREARGIIWHK